MKVRDIIAAIEEAAPLALQEDFDNSGLQVGDPDAEIGSALLCVDVTEAVVEEAVRTGAGMIVSHHPPLFHPLLHVTPATYVERVVAQALRNGIALYAAHTNLDNVRGGMNYRMGNLLGLENVSVLAPSAMEGYPGSGSGLVGDLPGERDTLDFLAFVKERLGAGSVRYSRLTQPRVRRVALCTGAGGSFIGAARASGAQVYVTADLRYNNFLDADRELVVADVGHFESEYCAVDLLYDVIRKKFPTFALRKGESAVNPVNYLI